MERIFFFLGFCPPSIRAVWRGSGIFQQENIRDLGRNPPLAPLFSFGELGAGLFVTIKLKKVLISVSIILCPEISNSYMLSIYGK